MAGSEGLHVRLDRATHKAVQDFAKSNGMTTSQAARAILTLGLEKTDQIDKVFARQTFKEGLIAGERAFKQIVAEAIQSMIKE